MTTLFISDLHLDPSRPAVTRAFLDLLEGDAKQADALYILGDFFEAWIGDDDDAELNQQVSQALKVLTDGGVPCYLMHGNRDFLIGEQFPQQSGCQLISDPTVVDLYGKSVLLMHGDSLCTGDQEYIAFRQQVRSPQWQQAVLSRSLEERRIMAQQLRAQSKDSNSNKAEDIMDVTPEEVVQALETANTDLLIHGHTHRPAIHELQTASGEAKRVVLGDWLDFGWVLEYQADNQYQLKKFTIQPV
jgi:UDP-2,3-diacylglucosamine hydrolase